MQANIEKLKVFRPTMGTRREGGEQLDRLAQYPVRPSPPRSRARRNRAALEQERLGSTVCVGWK